MNPHQEALDNTPLDILDRVWYDGACKMSAGGFRGNELSVPDGLQAIMSWHQNEIEAILNRIEKAWVLQGEKEEVTSMYKDTFFAGYGTADKIYALEIAAIRAELKGGKDGE